ncbi:MAG TPA: NADH-quinone oxidoreductase subunit J [Actinomycetospora sp.]|jgi:NADH-quinone oxidoreductase subunit J|uniref:NADH-quinone oxidoreductase subunit J n=1 Tax=Actinomycetospora sp. TaxID=1872135 RepID=UPI002F40160F
MTTSTGEAVAFWILGPVALAGGLGMVFSRNAVHSALWLVLTMLSLGGLYMVQSAPFLGFTQIIVYTGAIMMLFIFVLMMVGRDASDSVVEVLRGQRVSAAILGIGFAALLLGAVANSVVVPLAVGPAPGSNVGNLGLLIYQRYLLAFELTSALIITGALGAMVYTFAGRAKAKVITQRERVTARLLGPPEKYGSRSGPGVFATGDSVATPALLPDGSVAPESLSSIIEATARERLGHATELAHAGDAHDQHARDHEPHHEAGHEAGHEARHEQSEIQGSQA